MSYPTNATSMISAKFQFQHRYLGVASFEMLYEPNAAVTQLGLQNIVDAVSGGFSNVWKEIADHETSMIGVTGRYLAWEGTPVERIAYDFTTVAGDRGDIVEDATSELDALPPYVALLVRKYTDKPGRPNRGRIFIPYLSEQIQHDGIIDEGNEADVKACADFLHTPLSFQNIDGGEFFSANPRLWNLKDNLFVPITRMMATNRLVTRRDRALKTFSRPLT